MQLCAHPTLDSLLLPEGVQSLGNTLKLKVKRHQQSEGERETKTGYSKSVKKKKPNQNKEKQYLGYQTAATEVHSSQEEEGWVGGPNPGEGFLALWKPKGCRKTLE